MKNKFDIKSAKKSIKFGTLGEPENKYVGQALAVVMIILVVAVIIAMAIVSRSQSEQAKVADERSSAESVSLSDSVLEGVASVPVDILADIVNNSSETVIVGECQAGLPEYDFLKNGCQIEQAGDVIDFLEIIDSDGSLSSLASLVEEELANECGGEAGNIALSLTPLEEGEELVIFEGDTLSLVSYDESDLTGCFIDVTATPDHEGSESGLLYHSIYFSPVNGYLAYDYPHSGGICLFNCIGNADWQPVNPNPPLNNGWENLGSPAVFSTPAVRAGYNIEELRLRAVKDDIRVSFETRPKACIELEEFIKARVTVSCAGNTRAKEAIIPKATWAPSVFDYVLYNGEGSLGFDATF